MPDDPSALIAGLLGLGTSVAGSIPGLIPGTSEEELERIARGGGGAGAALARSTASQSARDALAIAGGGQGATRGLALRTGLRQAGQTSARGAEQASTLAAREQQAALGSLEQVRQRRLQNIQGLAGGLGGGLASIGALGAVGAPPAGAAGAATGALQQAPAAQAPQQAPQLGSPVQPQLAPPGAPNDPRRLAQPAGQVLPAAQAPAPAPLPASPPPIDVRAQERAGRLTAPLGQLQPVSAAAPAPTPLPNEPLLGAQATQAIEAARARQPGPPNVLEGIIAPPAPAAPLSLADILQNIPADVLPGLLQALGIQL